MKDNVFSVSKMYVHFVNDRISTYTRLYQNFNDAGMLEQGNIRFEKACAYSLLSDDIDALIDRHYQYVRVTEQLYCESFIWSLIKKISKRIDYVNSFGYDYVMHSYTLSAQLDAYTDAYKTLHSYCDMFHVFTGNMH